MSGVDLSGYSILIVQKDISTALDVQDAFADAGARVVTSYRVESAVQHAEHVQLSAAVIDASLLMEDRRNICDRLTARQVPFILYGADPMSEERAARVLHPFVAVERVAGLVRAPTSNASVIGTNPIARGTRLGLAAG